MTNKGFKKCSKQLKSEFIVRPETAGALARETAPPEGKLQLCDEITPAQCHLISLHFELKGCISPLSICTFHIIHVKKQNKIFFFTKFNCNR